LFFCCVPACCSCDNNFAKVASMSLNVGSI
jgi:hypothetical protein